MVYQLTMEQAAAVLRELTLVHPSNTRRVEACEMGALALEEESVLKEDTRILEQTVEGLRHQLREKEFEAMGFKSMPKP